MKYKYPNIESERARSGMSRRQLAAALGINRETYFDWLEGKYPVPYCFCLKMADMFNCNVDYLLAVNTNEASEKWKRYKRLAYV